VLCDEEGRSTSPELPKRTRSVATCANHRKQRSGRSSFPTTPILLKPYFLKAIESDGGQTAPSLFPRTVEASRETQCYPRTATSFLRCDLRDRVECVNTAPVIFRADDGPAILLRVLIQFGCEVHQRNVGQTASWAVGEVARRIVVEH